MDVVEAFRGQAAACGRLGSTMYADLLGRVADDLEAGGPARELLAGHEDDPGPSGLALRLAGSVHRLVLQRRAGALATYYPSVGGTWESEAGWAAFRAVLEEQPDQVREWLDRPPQTNEVGRASGLMAGLLELARHHDLPVRLAEIGSSGGLNLLADRFRYVGPDGAVGPGDSPVVLDPAWTAGVPLGRPPEIVERLGSDVMPVDVQSTEGRLALTAYVWPDQVHRFERLRGAFALAAQSPYEVRRQSAAEFVDSLTPAPGAVTVLWHSIMWQYVPRDEQARVTTRLEQLGASATPASPLAHLFVEPTRRTPDAPHEFLLCLQTWSGDDATDGVRRVLATVAAHGLPVTWE